MTRSAVPSVPAPFMFPNRKLLLLHFLPILSISCQLVSQVYIRVGDHSRTLQRSSTDTEPVVLLPYCLPGVAVGTRSLMG